MVANHQRLARHFVLGLVVLVLAAGWLWSALQLAEAKRLLARGESNQERLRNELEALRSRAGSWSTIQASSVGTDPELLRLRGEVAYLRRIVAQQSASNRVAERRLAATGDKTPGEPVVHQVTPVSSLSFAGYLTPEAGVQSVIWSMSTGNLESYLESLTPAARALAEAEFKSRPRDEIAQSLRDEVSGIKGLRLDQIQFDSNSSISINLSSIETDDGSSKFRDTTVIKLELVDGLWKMSHP